MALVDDKSKKVVMVTDEESTIVDVSKQDASSVRKIMKDYWDRWVGDPTESGTSLELMVGERNYKQAKELHESDMMEVLGLLPNLKGMDVLELGGGSGRLSGELAKKAKSVVATDFVEAFVKENEETNGPKYPNMTFRTLDAAKLDYPPNTFDLIFSNWLLMYLSDTETTKYAYNNLMMLKPGGFTFFRESHFRPVGSRPQAVNPTVYRNMKEYRDFFSKARYTDENNVTYFFEFIYAGNCQTYIHRKGNPTQVYYLWRKTKVNESPSAIDIQQLLDKTLYNEEDMKVYNKVIGNGFVTPGGLDCSKELIVKLNLKADSLILDVGCGLGGLEAYLVKECDIDVTGLELSLLASQAAVLRMNSLEAKKGHMHIADVAHTNFASNMFDAIFARETLEYIGNKETILKKTHRWLKSNGQLLMGDYCLGKEIIEGDTTALIQSEGLNIIAVDSYIKLLEESGYINVQSEDHSQQYISYLTEDLTKLETTEGIEDNTKKKFSTLWQSLVTSLTNKDLVWMVFVAKKQ